MRRGHTLGFPGHSAILDAQTMRNITSQFHLSSSCGCSRSRTYRDDRRDMEGDKVRVRITEVVLDGNKRTKLDFFQKILTENAIATETKQDRAKAKSADNSAAKIAPKVVTFEDLKASLHGVDRHLRTTQLFEDVDIQAHSSGEIDGIQQLTVKINVKEKQVLHFGVQTFAETNSNVGAEVYGGFRNPVGYGEHLVFSAKTTQQLDKHQDYMVQASFPFVGHRLGQMFVSTRKHIDRQATYFSSYDQDFFTVMAEYLSKSQKQRLSAEISHRREIPFTIDTDSSAVPGESLQGTLQQVQRNLGLESQRQPSTLIANAATTSWKTSLRYWHQMWDTRNSLVNPTEGHSLEGSVEVALPPGQAQFLKLDMASQWHQIVSLNKVKSLWQSLLRNVEMREETDVFTHQPHLVTMDLASDAHSSSTKPTPTFYRHRHRKRGEDREEDDPHTSLVLSVAASMGIMYPLHQVFASMASPSDSLASSAKRSFLSDRYHMGGPMNLRGFRAAGIGPRAFSQVSDDSVGGDTKRNLLVMLSYPVHNVISRPQYPAGGQHTIPQWMYNVHRSFWRLAEDSHMRVFVFAQAGSIGSPSYWLQSKSSSSSPGTASTASANASNANNAAAGAAAVASSMGNHSPTGGFGQSQGNNGSSSSAPLLHPCFGFWRVSVGGGLSMIVAETLRLEATYSVPLVYGVHTDHVKAFQLGIGLSMQ